VPHNDESPALCRSDRWWQVYEPPCGPEVQGARPRVSVADTADPVDCCLVLIEPRAVSSVLELTKGAVTWP
jgi:hypothetical protein